jgi:mannose-6-phosphate isomerase-like protein (cupin superfamily)
MVLHLDRQEIFMSHVIPLTGGERFKSGEDNARLIVSGNDTDGRYSILEWTIAAYAKIPDEGIRDYGVHLHRRCEETFLIQEGSLEFLVDNEVVVMNAGDFVRVPPGVKHGYQNTSGSPVKMLVTFMPGGFEELFLKYRTDQDEVKGAGFVSDATEYYGSEFGLANP